MRHEEEYYWVVMKPKAETFSLGKQVIMCKMIWEDGLVEWLLPGSLALWKPDKDFMILEKVPAYKPFERHITESDFLQHSESWKALQRLIGDQGVSAGFAFEFDDLCAGRGEEA